MSQLCCTAGAARQDLTVQHHTAAYAGAKRQDHGAVHILSAARYHLAQRGGIGVISQTDGITAVFLNGGPEIKIFPMEVGGVADDTAVILHNAGTAHAHAADSLGIVSFRQSCDQICDLAGHVLRSQFPLGGAGGFLQDRAAFCDNGPFDAGAAEINTDVVHMLPP